MSGRHPWNKLFEDTFSPDQRARIIREADNLVADNRRRQPSRLPEDSQDRPPRHQRATPSTRPAR